MATRVSLIGWLRLISSSAYLSVSSSFQKFDHSCHGHRQVDDTKPDLYPGTGRFIRTGEHTPALATKTSGTSPNSCSEKETKASKSFQTRTSHRIKRTLAFSWTKS